MDKATKTREIYKILKMPKEEKNIGDPTKIQDEFLAKL
jgi:hypothetical protein